ncbi:dynamin family protein [Halalkalibacter nanhaiisediminis]|nr:dynamin family protein [Halalkalibacter nanhaiisediminis]
MTLEKTLINKTYYESFMLENENKHPIEVLAIAFLNEQQDESADLSIIRFAQGEVYYHYKDFESAIYKWEQIKNDLGQWAKKNIADAYYELRKLTSAEDMYLSIDSENLILKTEVALQLFSLYLEQGMLDEAAKVIKGVVDLNPDYPNVTNMARSFFEKYRDFSSAIELAVNEAIRKETAEWFDILKTYVDQGLTKTTAPAYFTKALRVLANIDQARFEQLAAAFWKSYQNAEFFFTWIIEFNHLFLNVEVQKSESWQELSGLYQDTYFELINGRYYIREIENVIPNLLTNWVKIATPNQALITSTAVLSWSEIFPSSISSVVVEEASGLFHHSDKSIDNVEASLQLFEAILLWADNQQVELGYILKWIVQQLLDYNMNHLLVAGVSGSGKASFINSLVGEKILEASTSTLVRFKSGEETKIKNISNQKLISDITLSDFDEITATDDQSQIIDFTLPSEYLNEQALTVMNAPSYTGNKNERNEWFTYLHAADRLVFILDAQNPFTSEERDILSQIEEHAPNLPIHFILNKADAIYNEQEVHRVLEEARSKINYYYPSAQVIVYSSHFSHNYRNEIVAFMNTIFGDRNSEERNKQLLYFIRKTLSLLLEKRVEIEQTHVDAVNWNEEAVVKLNGAVNQLSDLENEKIDVIKKSYELIKEDINDDLLKTIPQLLRDCTDFIKEDSDLRNIQEELNKEMNKRIDHYIKQTLVPKFSSAIQEWLEVSNVEFIQSQSYLKEKSDGFNQFYGEERFKLAGDFRILDDWSRDTDRMTSGMMMENVHVALKITPSQFLLNSSGKLLGAFQTNKIPLYKMYKKHIENEDYDYVAEAITKQVMMPIEMFEKGLERDIQMFFKNPFNVLKKAIDHAHVEIRSNNDALELLKINPEIYFDPLKLFEVRLRQCELMIDVKSKPRVIL